MISRRRVLALGAAAAALGVVPFAWVDERAVMASVLDRLFAGAGPRPPSQLGAVEAAEGYIAALPPWTRVQLRGLWRALDAAPLPRTGRRWLALGPEEQDAVLEALSGSDHAAERLLVHAARQVGAMAVYSRDAVWPGIGYPGPR